MAYRIAVLVAAVVALSPTLQAQETIPSLTFIDSVSLFHRKADLTEPSGLAVRKDEGFWVVSDDTSALFAVGQEGEILDRIDLSPVVPDIEAVTEFASGNRVLVLSEAGHAIVEVDPKRRRVVAAYPIAAMTGGDTLVLGDDGPEGLTIGESGRVWLLIERPPVLVGLSPDLSAVSDIRALNGASGYVTPKTDHPDASGLAYDRSRKGIWILSDTAEAVFFRPDAGDRFVRYDLVFTDDDGDQVPVSNPEGVAISEDGSTLSIVTDDGKSSRLLHYQVR